MPVASRRCRSACGSRRAPRTAGPSGCAARACRRTDGTNGDLLVTVEVQVPQTLNGDGPGGAGELPRGDRGRATRAPSCCSAGDGAPDGARDDGPDEHDRRRFELVRRHAGVRHLGGRRSCPGMHPQTLRAYDRLGPGLARPVGGPRPPVLAARRRWCCARCSGCPRRRASTCPGIKRILELERRAGRSRRALAEMHAEIAQLRAELESTRAVAARLAGLLRSRGPRRPLVPVPDRAAAPARPVAAAAAGRRPPTSELRRHAAAPSRCKHRTQDRESNDGLTSSPARARRRCRTPSSGPPPTGNPHVDAPAPAGRAARARSGGTAAPLLRAVGADPAAVLADAEDQLARLPRRPGRRSARRRPRGRCWRCWPPRPSGPRSWATSTSPPSTCWSGWPRTAARRPTVLRKAGASPDALLDAFEKVRGHARVTSEDPEGTYQALEKYGVDLTAAGPGRQARPGDRPGRRDPAGGPGAVPPDQEQPGADRRARASARPPWSRAWPSGSWPATCPSRCAASGWSRSTWARWSPARSTAASSRSGSRPC